MHFAIYKNASGQYRYVLRGTNGETMAASETMARKQSCLDAIATIKKGAATAPILDETGEAKR